MKNLLAFGTDSYKMSHWKLYPEDTETVYSYCEARSGARFPHTCFFGLQYFLKRYLTGQIVTQEKIEEAASVCKAHFGNEAVFNRAGWEHILTVHNGKLPIMIRALPEGTVTPESTVLFTIQNTGGPRTAWLTNYLETLIMQMWMPTTVATSSLAVRNIIRRYLDATGDVAGLDFKLHDFGYRGVGCPEYAALAGAAHLATGAMGTDTMVCLDLLRDYYGENMAGFSIPATEHSIMTARGPEGEADVVRQVLAAYPQGLVAMVIDSFDTRRFIRDVIGGNEDIKQMIRARQGTVVFRPDSGELPEIDLEVFKELARVFGTETNPKGYAVLPSQVRMIQGDGIKWCRNTTGEWQHTVEDILSAFRRNAISADNIAFGSGGGLLTDFTRDTQRFAIKCSAQLRNDEWIDIFKAPATDPTKNSKRGRLMVRKVNGVFRTERLDETLTDLDKRDWLQLTFLNGKMMRYQNLADIRKRANE
jgi:nicotinamide phosphoribosyltransferase